jgi:hypothetical protein
MVKVKYRVMVTQGGKSYRTNAVYSDKSKAEASVKRIARIERQNAKAGYDTYDKVEVVKVQKRTNNSTSPFRMTGYSGIRFKLPKYR